MKHEWRKHEKNIYLPKKVPEYIELKPMTYICIEGQANPNSQEFAAYVEALYSMAYGIRMSYKWSEPPENYEAYTVYPLEGMWDLINPKDYDGVKIDKDNLKFELMIRQPDFVDEMLFMKVLEKVKNKKVNPLLDSMKLKVIEEGACVQVLHLGSYDTEPETFKMMENYCVNEGYERLSKNHKEIYLSDPRKVAPEKLKTVLRFRVKTR